MSQVIGVISPPATNWQIPGYQRRWPMPGKGTETSMISHDGIARGTRARRAGDLLPVLAILGVLVLAMSWTGPALSAGKASDAKTAVRHFADTEAAIADAASDEMSSFGLPPVVVRVRDPADMQERTITFKADLVFDEVDQDRIDDSISVSKHLLPRIMDSVLTGLDGKHIANPSDPETVKTLVVERANLVLKPYGVVVRTLKMQYLGWQ